MIEGKVLKVNGVELEIAPESLIDTDRIIRQQDRQVIERLAEGYGVEVGPGHPPSALTLMVRSHVQNEWYAAFKGEIPAMVQQKHTTRQEQVKKEAAKNAPPVEGEDKPKAARVRKTQVTKFRFKTNLTDNQKVEVSKIRGQRQLFVKALQDLKKEATPQELADQAIKNLAGQPFPSKFTDIPGSALYHMRGLKAQGLVDEIAPEPVEADEAE